MSDSTVKRYIRHADGSFFLNQQLCFDSGQFVLASDYDDTAALLEASRTLVTYGNARIAALQSQLSACQSALEKREGELDEMTASLGWAYGKLCRFSFTAMGDALEMDQIKLILTSPPEEAKPVPQKGDV